MDVDDDEEDFDWDNEIPDDDSGEVPNYLTEY
jgi:hypothetical protein